MICSKLKNQRLTISLSVASKNATCTGQERKIARNWIKKRVAEGI